MLKRACWIKKKVKKMLGDQERKMKRIIIGKMYYFLEALDQLARDLAPASFIRH